MNKNNPPSGPTSGPWTEPYHNPDQAAEHSRYLEAILDNSVDVITACDRDMRFTIWNKRAEEHYKLCREEVIGRLSKDLFPRLQTKEYLALVSRVLEGETIHVPETRGADGSERSYEMHLVPLWNGLQKPGGVLCILRDITESARVKTELMSMNAELRAVNTELTSLTSITGHNLKEPLRKVYSFIEQALADRESSHSNDAKMSLRRAQGSVQRMNLLIDDLLSFAHLGLEEKEVRIVDLNQVMEHVLHEHRDQIVATQAKVRIDAPIPSVQGYPHMITRLVYNILDNALKYQAPGNIPEITVSAAALPGSAIDHASAIPGKCYTVLSIRDNGVGFDQRHEDVIFQMFQRLVRKTEYGGGTGIGLAICKRIAGMHGGFIRVESRPGMGSVFHIGLPR